MKKVLPLLLVLMALKCASGQVLRSKIELCKSAEITSFFSKDGETLSSIAARSGLTFAELSVSNPGMPENLRAGSKIFLPPCVTYAKAGESVAGIAARFGCEPKRVAALNGLLPTTVLADGRAIRLRTGMNDTGRCTVSAADLPEIRGFRLGMSDIDVMKHFKTKHRLISSRLIFSDFDFINREEANGIRAVEFQFFNDRLISFTVDYGAYSPSNNASEFALIISDRLKLPDDRWDTHNFLNPTMYCSDFSISVDSTSLTLVDSKGTKEKDDAEKAEIERKKKTFKP